MSSKICYYVKKKFPYKLNSMATHQLLNCAHIKFVGIGLGWMRATTMTTNKVW